MMNRGYSLDDCQQLIAALYAYKAGAEPYHMSFPENGVLQSWWLRLRNETNSKLVDLAVLLTQVVPQVAAPECTIGWFRSKQRNTFSMCTDAKMTAIKMHWDQEKR